MRFISVVGLILPLVILVIAAPITNFRNELREMAAQTELLLSQDNAKSILISLKSVVDTKVAHQDVIDDCQRIIDQWASRNESWVQDDTQFKAFCEQIYIFKLKCIKFS